MPGPGRTRYSSFLVSILRIQAIFTQKIRYVLPLYRKIQRFRPFWEKLSDRQVFATFEYFLTFLDRMNCRTLFLEITGEICHFFSEKNRDKQKK